MNILCAAHVCMPHEGYQQFILPWHVCCLCPTCTAPLCSETGRGWTVLHHTAVRVLARHQLLPSMIFCVVFFLPLSFWTSSHSLAVGSAGSAFLQAAAGSHCSDTQVRETSKEDSLEKVYFMFFKVHCEPHFMSPQWQFTRRTAAIGYHLLIHLFTFTAVDFRGVTFWHWYTCLSFMEELISIYSALGCYKTVPTG